MDARPKACGYEDYFTGMLSITLPAICMPNEPRTAPLSYRVHTGRVIIPFEIQIAELPGSWARSIFQSTYNPLKSSGFRIFLLRYH